MPAVALDPAYRRVSVEEFLEMDFQGAKAELEDGLIFMMTGGTVAHSRVAGNIYFQLRLRLEGSRCQPFGSDLAARTGDRSVRYPDVSVYCRPADEVDGRERLLGDPEVVFEVLSPSTSRHDQKVKLEEYRALAGTRDIVFIDPDSQRIRHVHRTGADDWIDRWLGDDEDLALESIGVTLTRPDVFAGV